MKNQYFGDTRDLFTYDLAIELLLTTPLKRYTFIPMLTPDDNPKEGQRTNFHRRHAGYMRKDLVDFLQRCVSRGERDIRKLEEFFDHLNRNIYGKRIELYIHRPEEFFDNSSREEYFSSIPSTMLRDSLVFLDPDNGLEVKSFRGVKHLRYDELASIYDRSRDSVVKVFQFIPRVKRQEYFNTIGKRIMDALGIERVIYISDNQIVFFLLPKGVEVFPSVARYARVYNLLYGEIAK